MADHPQRAVELLSQARELDPASGEIALDLGATLLSLGRYGEAKSHLQAAVELLPESPLPHYNLGWLHQELGQLDSAAREYEAALALAPDDSGILENLLLTYTELGTQHRRRIELIDRALLADSDPDWQEWLRLERHLLLAFAEEKKGEGEADQQQPAQGQPAKQPSGSPEAGAEPIRLFPPITRNKPQHDFRAGLPV